MDTGYSCLMSLVLQNVVLNGRRDYKNTLIQLKNILFTKTNLQLLTSHMMLEDINVTDSSIVMINGVLTHTRHLAVTRQYRLSLNDQLSIWKFV